MDAQFRLLGPMEITVDEQPVRLPGAAERALLAQLLLSPRRTLPATLLIDRLWAESSLPVDPMNALQIRVSKLRRSLASMGLDGVVARDGVGYRADVPDEKVDALEFVKRIRTARAAASEVDDEELLEQYDAALGLWRGEPLTDFSTEQWATAEAVRLNEAHLAALTERAQLALRLGRHLEVVTDLEPLVAADPTLESLTGLLMIALYRSGRQADALEVFARTRTTLDDELGLEPSVSLRSLHERVLRQDESLGAQPELGASVPVLVRRAEERQAPTNLPTVARPLIGRDEQLDALTELLGGVRLLTLVGPGGAGKTSLALSAVVRSADLFPDGVFGVRLASVTSVDQIPFAVAEALGIPLDGAAADRDIRERIVTFLGRRRLLLLMDNCEHVVDGAASLIDEVLGRCADVTVLATSREVLAVPDEVQVTVGPLDVPPEHTAPQDVLRYPASQLFAERARAVRPGLVFDSAALDALGRIVRTLDGIPLALELAAARVASMSTAEIADRLDDRFEFLTSGARTAEARQQTLRATVDWSYALLSEPEQLIYNRLAVFHGGWSLTAAEAVVADDATSPGLVLDTIGRLVERSMVVAEAGPTTRYRMLETLRHYAEERLRASSEHDELRRRHAQHFQHLCRAAETELRGPHQREWLGRLREEQPNIRAALAWLAGEGQDLDAALSAAGALGLYWHLGRHLEGRETLARLLGRGTGSPAARALALQAVSLVDRPRACLVHPSSRCAETAAESLEIFERLQDGPRAAVSKVLLAVEGVTGVDRERSEALLTEAEAQFTHDGDDWGRGVIGFVRMETALKNGEEEAAVEVGRATAAAFRQLGDSWGLSAILYHLGWGLRQFGRYDEACRILEEAIDVATQAGLFNTVQWALADLGVAHVHLGNADLAGDLFDRAAAASAQVGDGAGEVLAEYGRGLLAETSARWTEARAHYDAARRGFQALGTPVMEGLSLVGLARCTDSAPAGLFEEAREIGERVGEPGLLAAALEGLSRTAEEERAAGYLAQARQVRERFHRPAPPLEAALSPR